TDEITDMRGSYSHNPIDRSCNLSITQIDLGLFDRGFESRNICALCSGSLQSGVPLLRTGHPFLEKRNRTLLVCVCLNLGRSRVFQISFRLGQRGLKGLRINLEEQIAFFDYAAVLVIL